VRECLSDDPAPRALEEPRHTVHEARGVAEPSSRGERHQERRGELAIPGEYFVRAVPDQHGPAARLGHALAEHELVQGTRVVHRLVVALDQLRDGARDVESRERHVRVPDAGLANGGVDQRRLVGGVRRGDAERVHGARSPDGRAPQDPGDRRAVDSAAEGQTDGHPFRSVPFDRSDEALAKRFGRQGSVGVRAQAPVPPARRAPVVESHDGARRNRSDVHEARPRPVVDPSVVEQSAHALAIDHAGFRFQLNQALDLRGHQHASGGDVGVQGAHAEPIPPDPQAPAASIPQHEREHPVQAFDERFAMLGVQRRDERRIGRQVDSAPAQLSGERVAIVHVTVDRDEHRAVGTGDRLPARHGVPDRATRDAEEQSVALAVPLPVGPAMRQPSQSPEMARQLFGNAGLVVHAQNAAHGLPHHVRRSVARR
jgi:hypothetical protein